MADNLRNSSQFRAADKRGVIQFHILMRLAYKNLFFNKLRTMLTVLAVIIGIGSIVFLFSFGFGLQNLVSQQVVGSSSVQTIDVTSPRSKILKLNTEAYNQISGMGGVDEMGRSYNTAGKIKQQSSQTETVVYGADTNFVDLSGLKYTAGNNFDADTGNKIIINNSLANVLGFSDNSKAIDKSVNLSFDTVNDKGEKKTVTKDFVIGAVFESESRAESFIAAKNFEQVGTADATQLKVVVNDKDKINSVRKAIESLGFTTTSPQDTLEQIDQVFNLLRYVFVGFGGIGIVIAILGMFNTLTISLIERTREIALMISLGARKQDIRRLFTTEAVLLSFLGGLFGVIGAITLSVIGNFALNRYAQHNGVKDHITAFSFSAELILITLALSALIGLIVVFFPARRATMIDPIEALHRD